jgi:hypothetical protein
MASLETKAPVFAAGALAGAALTALGAYCYSSSSSRSQSATGTNQLPAQPQNQQQPGPAHHASLQEFEQDEVLAEHLTRNVQFFGLEKQKQITNAFVVVIGLGVSKQYAFGNLQRGWRRLADWQRPVGATCAGNYS